MLGLDVYANETLPTTNTTAGGIEVLWKAFSMALRDLVSVFPKIFIAIAIVAVYVAIALIVTRLLRKILTIFRVDEIMKPLLMHTYFSVTNLVIALTNIGLAILALYSIVLTLFPEQVHATTLFIDYVARVASVVFLVIFVFISLSLLVERIRMEARLRGFMFLLLLFMSLVLIIDITALSPEVKAALAWGISIGIGLSIGVFSAWYFFHDIIEKYRREKHE
ncbi:hypothetical protein J4526_06190 [Desulfurococcaceae archaeon MEX13E-LK6-19]|nr:hypothetical protein J4526_06190 [Desulfurococcaceae archaeon MEX13E-LK6-19]